MGVTTPAAPPRSEPNPAVSTASPAPVATARPAVMRRTRREDPEPPRALDPTPPTAPPRKTIPQGELTREERLALLADGAARAEACRACPLGSQRTQAVYYDGDPMAKIVFIGEAPGQNEDQQGKPFVGLAGQLLNKMITAIGFKREEVFICNTVKCRPPQNRDPLPGEKAACEPFLIEQLEIVQPQIIVALGAHAAHYVCRTEEPIGRMRGRWYSYNGIPVLATYHPSFLLQKEGKADEREFKRRSWEDFKLFHARYCALNPNDPRPLWTKKESGA